MNFYLGTALFQLLLERRELLEIETQKLEILRRQNQEKERKLEAKKREKELQLNVLKEWMVVFNYGIVAFTFTLLGMALGSILAFNSGAIVHCDSEHFFCQLFTVNKK